MFLKLMKQDVRATARLMLPVYAAAIILAVFTWAFQSLADRLPESTFVSIFGGLTAGLFSLAMIAIVVMSFVLMIWRFYKNYMTDEGYLMFTLPVNTAELIWSKLVVALGWFVCSALVAALATAITSIGDSGIVSFDVDVFGMNQLPVEQVRRIGVSGTVLMVVAGIAGCLMLYACMAIGQSFRRHKKGMAVLFFFLFYILLQVVGVWVLSGVFEHLAANESVLYSSAAILEMTNGILWRFTAVAAVTGVVFYVITHIMLAKRLNLQ